MKCFSFVFVGAVALVAAIPLLADVEVFPARITGHVRFANTSPDILAILGAPGNEGMTSVYLGARAEGASAAAYSGEPLGSFLQKDFSLDVHTTSDGLRYTVGASVYLGSGAKFYTPRQVDAGTVMPSTTTTVNIEECVGLLRIRFIADAVSHAPAIIDGGHIEAQIAGLPATPPAPFGAASLPRTSQVYLALRGGETCNLTITYQHGIDPFSDTVFRREQATVTVPCDTIQDLDVVVSPLDSLGSISGTVDMLGENELPVPTVIEIRPDVANYGMVVSTHQTLVEATGGPDLNYRYKPLSGTPSSGPFTLENLLPSDAVSPAQPYTVAAGMTFDHRFSYGSPAIGAVAQQFFSTPKRTVLVRNGETNLANTFVINPGFLSGTVRLRGPTAAPGRPSPLQAYSGARVYAYGVNEVAPGADFSAEGGVAYGSMPGAFDESSSQLVGHYELALGGLNGQDSIWRQPLLAVGFYTNSPDTYLSSTVQITDSHPGSFTVSAGSRGSRNLDYCFGQVIVNFHSSAGRLFNPTIPPGGTGTASSGDYSVYINGASGTPVTQATASNRAQVTAILPVGTYNFGTSVQLLADDGTITTISPGAINGLEVHCGDIITLTPPCLSVALDSSRCFPTPSVVINGHATTCSNNVIKILYIFNGTTNLLGSFTGPNVPFSVPLTLNGPCTDHTLTVVATGEEDGEASITTLLRYDNEAPKILCPQDITVQCAGGQGVVVNFPNPPVSDSCPGPINVVCNPASGSLFPLGVTTVHCSAIDGCGNTNKCQFNVQVAPSKLTIETAICVRWQCGTLQSSASLDGPWQDVVGVSSPYYAPTAGRHLFYRVRE